MSADYNQVPIGLPYCVDHKETHTDCPVARAEREGIFVINFTPEAKRKMREALPEWMRYDSSERRSMAVNRMLAGSEE